MLILAVDSSAVAASCALLDGDKVLGESYLNVGLTHSRTLMPMVQNLLGQADCAPDGIDGFAVSCGPGSFTGIRIGVSAVKGMAAALNKPCAGISTLYAMAYLFESFEGIVCAVMDARRQQVYNGMFRVTAGRISRLCDDRAISLDALAQELSESKERVILTGDGSALCGAYFREKGIPVSAAPAHLRYQRAYGVARAAQEVFDAGGGIDAAQLMPHYLRLPQAERELKKKMENQS